jgi:hypothetical protein
LPLSARPRSLQRDSVARAALTAVLLVAGGLRATQPCIDESRPGTLAGLDRRALIVPLTHIISSYRDNTQAEPDTQYTDSFLLAAVNTFVRFETARRVNPTGMLHDSAAVRLPQVSRIAGMPASDGRSDSVFAQLADSADVQLVVVVQACSLGYRVFQADGWRNNSGPGYQRPVEATGFARVQIQIRERSGSIVYECVGYSTVDKPLLYSVFNGRRMRARREEAVHEDVVKAARKLYAPPVVRAIGRAVAKAMPVR